MSLSAVVLDEQSTALELPNFFWSVAQKLPEDFHDFRLKRRSRNVIAGTEDLGTLRQYFSETFKINLMEDGIRCVC